MRPRTLVFATGISAILWGSIAALVAYAQPPNRPGQFGSTQAEKLLERERDKDGDHISVNLKGTSATPTPGLANRCVVQCDAVADKLVASVNGAAFAPLTGTGSCACPGTGSGSTQVGPSSSCSAVGATCLGDSSTANTDGTALGFGCAAGIRGICIGTGSGATDGIVMGDLATGVANAFIAGSPTQEILTFSFGKGRSASSAGPQSWKGTNGSGTNNQGGSVGIIPGASTGNKDSGPLFFQYCAAGISGAAVNTCSTIATFDGGHFNVVDNAKIRFGDAFDSGIWYDGTNLIINPKLVGSGYIDVLGTIAATGHWTKSGGFGHVNEGTDVSVPTLVNITAAGDTIPITHPAVTITLDTNRSLTSTPTLANGADGQRVEIWVVDGADTLTLSDDGTVAGSNLELGASTRALALNDGLCLRYLGAIGKWVECGFWNN